ncbi:MAG: 16S rRNA (cytosine(1402)-N(4))-methyltransferase RsmH [Bacteroidetes bacterium]|nr:MAG: 16S rRNA (cytosine(1402)-N(4))-methyltransferase RsmH [Bacteroidota bacterium]
MKKKKKKKSRRVKINRAFAVDYDFHLPVLLNESIDLLVTDPDGIYIDGTLGGGGHTEEILKRLSKRGRVHSFDIDEEAVEHCRKKFWGELSNGRDSLLVIHNVPYDKACSIIGTRGKVQGFLLDLGVSSRQLDQSCRGFSYRSDSSLDMRFGSHGKSAAEFLHAAAEEELEKVLRIYGEEPFSRNIARRIIERRRTAHPISTTFGLREVVEQSVPYKLRYKSLSRVFQALRIAINNELEILERTLENTLNILSPGGRLAVISYHSLEDRIVKTFFKDYSKERTDYKIANTMPLLKILTKKPIVPSKEELLTNPRARSAKLRVAEKL